MNVGELITDLGSEGIVLWVESGQLRFRAPKGAFTDDRRAAVREHRDAIRAYLESETPPSIDPDPTRAHEPFPLSDLQAAYLIGRGTTYEYGGVACHAYVELGYPDLDPGRVQAAWDALVARHDMLRAVVHPDGYQVVLDRVPGYEIEVSDLRGQEPTALFAAVEAVRQRLAQRVAQTDRWPLFAAHLTRADGHAILHLSLDLLVIDYASVQLLLAEFDALYADHDTALPPLAVTFRDYLLARRRITETPAYARDRDYWLRRLDDLPSGPELALTSPTTAGDSETAARFRRLEHTLPAAGWTALRDRAIRHGVTPSTALLAAYAEVIGRWSRSPRFTLNVPTFQRLPLHPQIGQVIGDFTVVEPLVVDLTRPRPLAKHAAALAGQLLDDLAHGLFTGSEVLGELARRTGTRPLLPVVFTSTLDAPAPARTSGTVEYAVSQTPQVWIDCQVMPRGDELTLSWDVREGVLPDGVAADAFVAFTDLVTRLADDDATWAQVDPVRLPDTQLQRRRQANDTAGPLPRELLHEPVVAQARRSPDRIAVQAGEVRLTYGQLLNRARAVAAELAGSGLGPGEPVAVLMDKGWEQVVAVLGALLAGTAYLPVDTSQPAARRNTILTDARVRTVLTQSWLAGAADLPHRVRALAVDTLAPTDADVTPVPVSPDDLAYVIYTSGSTGTPKGVMISHRAARNTIDDINRRFAVGEDDAVLGLAGLGFDLSVYDVFGPLSVGGRLVLPDADRRADPSHWADVAAADGVTVWNSVPGQLQMLQEYLRTGPDVTLPALRLALLSGDWIPVTLPDAIRALLPELRVVSLGGATEGAIWSIWHPIGAVNPSRPSIPYGTPLANQTFHVLDDQLRDRPEWTPGELYIGGAGVAMGYYHDPERTAERFISHPVTGDRLYRTGDLGRYWPDGTIEFLGRQDNQVKIRGYRIELAEIEAAVQTQPGVAAVAVLVDTDPAVGKRLAAFVESAHRPLPLGESGAADTGEGAALGAAALAASRQAQSGIDPDALGAFQAALSGVALTAMQGTLRGAGLFAGEAAVDGRTAVEVSAALAATPTTAPIVARWLRALTAAGRLALDPATGRYSTPATASPMGDLDQAWTRLADSERAVNYGTDLIDAVRTCTRHLPELISGARDVRTLLFPGVRPATPAEPASGGARQADLMAAAYRDNLAIAHLNQATVAALRELAAHRAGDEPLRILEVGGGVAGTASELVPALAEFAPDYLFTDASQFFLGEARDRFADHPWVRYGRLDVRADLREQGYLPNSVDVVLAANHLHTATNADRALTRLHELLVPGGWLLFMEQTRDDDPALLVSMEFLEAASGPFTDARARAGQAFLTATQWAEALAAAGTNLVAQVPTPQDPLHSTGQKLFLAQAKPDRHRLTAAGLTRHATTRLPEYMVPATWQIVDALPLTGNGKVDRARLHSWLPRVDAQVQTAAHSSEPVDALERQLAGLWAELLDREHVGRHDDFFALGGDSLLVARLVGLLRERIPDVVALEWEVVLRHMLRQPTVAALAGYLRGVRTAGGRDADGEPQRVRTSPLVRLHGAGTDPVTVLVHAGTGTLMPYRAVITEIRRRSAGNAALVGLEVQDLRGFLDADPDGLIQRIAADYVTSVLDLGARELHLVGYCLGGLIATEVARGLAEAGANVATFTAISSHSPRFRLDDELLSEYSFSVMMGINPADLGFPTDELRVAAAADQVLVTSPGVMRDGGLAELTGEYADVAACFQRLAEMPRAQRVARMCEVVPASAGMYEPDHMMRLFQTFRQSVFAISRYAPEPYAGDITFLRHSGAYPFPGSRDAVTRQWEEVCLGDLSIVDVAGDHFSCIDVAHAPGIVKLLTDITDGAVAR